MRVLNREEKIAQLENSEPLRKLTEESLHNRDGFPPAGIDSYVDRVMMKEMSGRDGHTFITAAIDKDEHGAFLNLKAYEPTKK